MSARVDPFVGLAPYSEQDAEWFFGREREIELIVANLRAARLTLLYGGSGVGKSSVLQAGVMQRLHRIQDADREDARALGARRGVALAERPGLAVVMFRDWRDAPMPRLAAAIRAAVVDATGNQEIEPWDGEEPFADRLREQARHVRTVLVILDQFEEYFMYHPNEDGAGTVAGELPELIDDLDLRVNFLLGLREDALSRLDRFKGRIPDLFGNYLRLRYLERDAAREAIEKPVEHYNATVRAGLAPVTVEPALVEAVLDGVRAGRLALHESADPTKCTPESTRVETPYLQLVMRELWAAGTAGGAHEVSVRTLEQLGGAAKIVSNHLGKAMKQLTQEDQAVAADVFGFLVTPSRTKIAHAAEDLAVWANRPPEHVARVLRDLAASDCWVLRSVPPTSEEGRERYELYHDVLADAIHDWASRNQERRRLVESRRNRLRRWRRRGLLGFAWVVCAALAIAIVQSLGGDDEPSPAAAARQLAESSRTSFDADPERGVLLGLKAYERDPSSRAARAALRDAVMDSRLRAVYPRPCRLGCEALGPEGKPRSEAVAMPVGSTVRAYDPFYGPETSVRDDRSLSVSPDGRTVAFIQDRRVRLWDPATGMDREVRNARRVTRVAFIGVHGRLLLTTRDDEVRVADTRGAPRAELIAENSRLVAVSTDGRYVATAHDRGRVRVRDLRTGERTTLEPARRVTSLAFNPADSGELALGVRHTARTHQRQGVSLLRWRVGDERDFIRAKGRWLGPSEAEFRRDGRRLLVTAPGADPRVFRTARPKVVPDGAKQLEADVSWLGPQLMSVTGNVVNLRQGGWTTALGGHQDPVRDVAAGPGGSTIATGADDGTARIWDAATGNQLLQLRVSADQAVTHVEFTPSGEFLVTATEDGAVRLWNVATGSLLAGDTPMDAHFGGNESVVGLNRRGRMVTWSAFDGRRLSAGRRLDLPMPWYGHIAPEAGKVAYVDYRREKLVILSIKGDERPRRFEVGPFELSADGSSLLLLGARPKFVDLTRDASPVPLGNKLPSRAYVGAISADGRKVLVAGKQPAVFDVASPDRPVPLEDASRKDALSAAFSPDGSLLVTGGAEAVMWDTETGEKAHTLTGHRGLVTSVGYSSDGRWIVTGGLDRTVRLWDGETGRASGVVRGFRDRIESVELDPTDRYLLVEPWFDVPLVLSCTPCLDADELAQKAHRYVTRGLTAEELREAGLRR